MNKSITMDFKALQEAWDCPNVLYYANIWHEPLTLTPITGAGVVYWDEAKRQAELSTPDTTGLHIVFAPCEVPPPPSFEMLAYLRNKGLRVADGVQPRIPQPNEKFIGLYIDDMQKLADDGDTPTTVRYSGLRYVVVPAMMDVPTPVRTPQDALREKLVDTTVPENVRAAARVVEQYFSSRNERIWVLGGVCSRRYADKLARLRSSVSEALDNAGCTSLID